MLAESPEGRAAQHIAERVRVVQGPDGLYQRRHREVTGARDQYETSYCPRTAGSADRARPIARRTPGEAVVETSSADPRQEALGGLDPRPPAGFTEPMPGDARTTSLLSLWSKDSLLSIGSRGSVLSIGSVGSFASIGSIGSFGSLFSIGSALSAGSVLSWLSRWSLMSHLSVRGVLDARRR